MDGKTELAHETPMICPLCGSPPKPLAMLEKDDILTCYMNGHTLESRPVPSLEVPLVPVKKKRRQTQTQNEEILQQKKKVGKELRDKRVSLNLRAWSFAYHMEWSDAKVYGMENGFGYFGDFELAMKELKKLEKNPERLAFLKMLKREKLW